MWSAPGLIDLVSQSGSAGIGYNIYSYSLERELDTRGLKMLMVDDVKLSDETLVDGSYPLLVYTYSHYNAKGKALTDWLLTEEGQKVVASAGYVGIFGELPPTEIADFNKDQLDSENTAVEFYQANGWSSDIYPQWRIIDKAQIEALSKGKGKDLTVLWLVECHYAVVSYIDTVDAISTRFIVLTREKGGEFEVINEGEVEAYENGIITPGDDENHSPPLL